MSQRISSGVFDKNSSDPLQFSGNETHFSIAHRGSLRSPKLQTVEGGRSAKTYKSENLSNFSLYMPLFRLAWVTSCLSVLLAYSQSLLRLPNYFSSAVGHPLEVSIASASATPLFSSLPASALSGLQSSFSGAIERGLTRGPSQFTYGSNPLDTPACHTAVEPQKIMSPTAATAARLESRQETATQNIPQRLGKLMRNLFNRAKKERSTLEKHSSAVEVVVKPALSRASRAEWKLLDRDARGLPINSVKFVESEGLQSFEAEQSFQVWVNGKAIAQFDEQHQADLIAERLSNVLSQPDFNAKAIKLTLLEGKPAAMMGNRLLFVLDDAIAPQSETNRELLAINWTNRLRAALGATSLKLLDAQRQMYDVVETSATLEGLASWYGGSFHGRLTANGETYNKHAFTAAHPSLPFNTYLKVTNLKNNNSVIVRINDRGPFIPQRNLDLSWGVAQCIDSANTGVIPYSAILMRSDSPWDDI